MQNEGGVVVTCRECGKMFLGRNGTEKTRQQFEDGHVVIGEKCLNARIAAVKIGRRLQKATRQNFNQ